MISYYLLTTVVDALTAVNEDDWQIAADIKDGNISQFLLKPIDYLWYRLCLFLSGRVTYLAVAVMPLALFILYLHQYFVLPPNWAAFGCFLVSTVLTALLQFFMSYAMAMLAFWVLEVSTFIFILYAFEYLASGHLFPLDILPPGLEQALYFTPFPYQLYFPVSIYMGKTTGVDLAARPADTRPVGHRGLRHGALRVAPGHQEVFGGRRVRMKSEVRSPKSEVEESLTRNHATRNTPFRSRFTHHASRYLSIYAALWKNSVAREMSFKSNFLLWILVELLWFGLQLSFIGVLYLHTDHIGTWTKWQVVMLIGASHFIQQIYQAFFLINCTNLSELVRTGKLDFLLLLPVNTRFVVSLRQVDLGAFVNAASAVALMVYAAHQLHLVPTLLQVLGFLALCVTGIAIHYSFDVPAGQHQLLDRARAGHCLGLLQPVQYCPHARRGFPRAVQGRLHFRPAHAAGVQRPGAAAGGQAEVPRAGVCCWP